MVSGDLISLNFTYDPISQNFIDDLTKQNITDFLGTCQQAIDQIGIIAEEDAVTHKPANPLVNIKWLIQMVK